MRNGHYIDNYGHQVWYQNGKYHRLDGPAIIDGNYQSWWIEGEQYTKEEFYQKILEICK